MKPLVSILIPAFNAARWIGDTLRSALGQEWPRIEVIVVDDGSTDQTLSIARGFESRRVRVVTQPNAGATAARNTALALCQGDWIQWLDADDLLAPGKIQEQMAALRGEENPRILLSSAWGSFMSRPKAATFRPTALWQDLQPVEWLLTQLEQNLHMQTATWLTSRQLTEAAGPWDARLAAAACDDGEYFSRVILASERIRFVPEAKVWYRVVGTSRLSYIGRSELKMDAVLSGLQLYFANLRAKDDTPRVRAACVKYLQTTLNEMCPESAAVMHRAKRIAEECGGVVAEPTVPAKYAWLRWLFGRSAAKRVQVKYNEAKWAVLRLWDGTIQRFERMGGRR